MGQFIPNLDKNLGTCFLLLVLEGKVVIRNVQGCITSLAGKFPVIRLFGKQYVLVLHLDQSLVPSTQIHTTAASRDIEQAAKFIGAGAATVGCAGMLMLDNLVNV